MPSNNNSIILPPQMIVVNRSGGTGTDNNQQDDELECSVHTLPKPLLREFGHVFGEKYLTDDISAAKVASGDDDDDAMEEDPPTSTTQSQQQNQNLELIAIPTNQRARRDLVAVGDDVEEEKDRLLNVFLDFGSNLCNLIRTKLGYWADYIDPCSGLPMLTKDCNKVYSEVDGMECLLNYRAHSAGFCKILTHPKWGSAVYPATIFVYGNRNSIIQLLHDHYPPTKGGQQ